jgi:hypothetical protein
VVPGAAGQPLACRLALLDGRSGGVQSTLPACGAGETVTGLALGADPAQPMVYLAIRDDSPRRLFTTVEGRHRIVAMNAATGAVLATSPLDGVPSLLAAAPVSWGRPRWLYAIQEPPRSAPTIGRLPLGSLGPAGVITGSAAPARATGRQLIRLRPDSLEMDRAISIGGPVSALAAGDDREVYLLQADTLTRVTMSTGVVQTAAHLPGPGHDLAVTPRWVFVTHPEGDEVWAIERRTGRLVRRIATGREPLGISVVLT